MAVTFSDFVQAYPEFSEAGEPMVQNRLDEAARETPAGIWGDHADKAIMLRAADSIATGPGGANANIEPDKQTSYRVELERLMYMVTSGVGRVI